MIDTCEQIVAKNFTLYTYPMSLVEAMYRNISFKEMELPHDRKAYYEGTVSTKLKYNKEHTVLCQELYTINLHIIEALKEIHRKYPGADEKQQEKSELLQSLHKYMEVYNITPIPRKYGTGLTPSSSIH